MTPEAINTGLDRLIRFYDEPYDGEPGLPAPLDEIEDDLLESTGYRGHRDRHRVLDNWMAERRRELRK